ncbi:MAG: transporter substrate-binding domain-containing protein, partial [Oxalobacter sp.]|nr:transporter substrate-binding domain-containing protein [Oxalobacter sp.]
MEKKPDILARLLLFLLAFLFAGSFAMAQENANRAARTIRAGFPVIAGFGHINEDGTYSGYNYDYLQKLAQHTGWKYEFVPCTWDECIKMLDNGEIDLLGGIQRTPAREKQFRFAELESFLNYNV